MQFMVSPQKYARLGMFCLKEAVLDLLEQPEHKEASLQSVDISEF